jgi:hypothetical protein
VVDYDDGGSWPISPDGSGPSLVLCDPNLDNSLATNWSAATTFVGVNSNLDSIWANPGAGCGVTPPPPAGDTIAPLVINVVLNSATSLTVNYSEAVDSTSEDTTNYQGLGSITSAVRGSNWTSVDLTLATALSTGMNYNLTISSVKDTAGNVMDSAQTFMVMLQNPSAIYDLVITEINYNGPEGGADTTEFIEIYNNDTVTVNLGGYSFVQGVTYTFPSVNLAPASYFVVAYDSAKLNNYFNVSSYEWTSGGLSNSGEDIILVNQNGDTIDIVDYDDNSPWPMSADGSGPSLVLCNPSLDNSLATNWSASLDFYGVNAAGDSIWASPGAACGTLPPPPAGDTIPPIATSALVQSASSVLITFNEPVGVSAENVSNYTGIGTVSTAVRDAQMTNVTLTLSTPLVNGNSYTLTVSSVADTAGNLMAAPQNFPVAFNSNVSDLLITEIMSNDLSNIDSLEYFEVYNNGSSVADLTGCAVTDGIDYTFPAGTSINPGEFLVVAKDSALVNSVFGINGTHQWLSGGLKNSGEAIMIQNSLGDTLAFVDYDDNTPWPVEADGDGPSMEFCDKTANNNDGANWMISTQYVTTFNGDSIFGTPGSDCKPDGFGSRNKNALMVQLFPNPTNDIMNIVTESNDLQLFIFDLNGRLVLNQYLVQRNNQIDVRVLRAGLYHVQLIDGKTGAISNKKLIVK